MNNLSEVIKIIEGVFNAVCKNVVSCAKLLADKLLHEGDDFNLDPYIIRTELLVLWKYLQISFSQKLLLQ